MISLLKLGIRRMIKDWNVWECLGYLGRVIKVIIGGYVCCIMSGDVGM